MRFSSPFLLLTFNIVPTNSRSLYLDTKCAAQNQKLLRPGDDLTSANYTFMLVFLITKDEQIFKQHTQRITHYKTPLNQHSSKLKCHRKTVTYIIFLLRITVPPLLLFPMRSNSSQTTPDPNRLSNAAYKPGK